MTLTPNYDPTPLAPKVLIHDLDGNLQYTYEASQIAASPTQDFYLRALSIHLGKDDDFGNATLVIDDPSNTLTDTTNTRRVCKIKRQWSIQVYLGKSSGTLNRWFYGKIVEADVIRPTTNIQQIRLTCTGWGIRLKDRITNIKRFQAKDTDGLTLLSSDTNVRASELAKDIVTDTDHYPTAALTSESGITSNGVDTIDVKLANFQMDFQTWAHALADLAASGNSSWGLDGDRDLYFRDGFTNDSGFLFTNNLSGTTAQGWSSTKIGYLFNEALSYTDSSVDCAYSFLHGYGADVVTKDVEYNSANATRSLHSSWLAIPFTPTSEIIAKCALSLSKTGTPSSASDANVDFRIIGDDGGSPDIGDLRKQTLVNKGKFDSLTGTGAFTEIAFDNVSVSPGEQLFLMVRQFGSASHTIVADYQTGSGTYYTSADGSSWSSATGNFKIRSYTVNPIIITLEDTTARRKFGVREKVIPFRNKTQEETARSALEQISQILCKEKREYSSIAVSPPTDRIPLGKYCKLEDSFTGLSVLAEITSVDVSMVADNHTNIGADRIHIGLQEFHY